MTSIEISQESQEKRGGVHPTMEASVDESKKDLSQCSTGLDPGNGILAVLPKKIISCSGAAGMDCMYGRSVEAILMALLIAPTRQVLKSWPR